MDGPDFAREEMVQIQASLEEETGTFSELFAPGMRYAFLIGLLLAFFNNWSGWSVMGGYIPMLIEASGLEDRAQGLLQFAVAYGFMGAVTLFACLVVDRVGRRPLWLAGSAMMCVITAITGAVFHYQLSGGLVLMVIILCTIPHGLALGPLPWLMMSEIFPTRLAPGPFRLPRRFLWLTIYSGAQLFPIISGLFRKKNRIHRGHILAALGNLRVRVSVRSIHAAGNQRQNSRGDRGFLEETLIRKKSWCDRQGGSVSCKTAGNL